MRVTVVITGLSTGGAETMLLKLLEHIDRNRFSMDVQSLTDLGDIGPRIRALGIPVQALGMKRGVLDVFAIIELARRLRKARPRIVHTWMYHADVIGGLAARLAGVRTVIWGIRNSNLDRDKTKLATRLAVRVSALLSRWVPTGILSCSKVARDIHVAVGYAPAKMAVVPNGFDLARFQPDPHARLSVRRELNVPLDTSLIGIVGRFDPQKNHAGFFDAAALVRRARGDVHFVLVGTGLDTNNHELVAAARRAGVSGVVHWLGRRDDIPRLMAAFDVLALPSSYGEAFPNVLGEAMACGVPCAVTDVGDSAAIVGDTGRVVRPGDMNALAAAIEDLLSMTATQRASIEHRAQERVREHFEIRKVVKEYEDYYEAMAWTAE